MEVAKEGSSREKVGTMFLKSVTVGVGRGGPELTHHIKPELLTTGHRLEPVCCTVTLGTQCFPPFLAGETAESLVNFICQSEKTDAVQVHLSSLGCCAVNTIETYLSRPSACARGFNEGNNAEQQSSLF